MQKTVGQYGQLIFQPHVQYISSELKCIGTTEGCISKCNPLLWHQTKIKPNTARLVRLHFPAENALLPRDGDRAS